MQRFVAYDGSVHPVRDGFNIWPDGWTADEEARMLEVWRASEPAKPGLLANAEARAHYKRAYEAHATGGLLNERERRLLEAWTNRRNIDKALAWIAPHDYADFGFETACQVHGNSHSIPCGCHVHLVFDHHKRDRLTDEDKHPFRAVEVCELHSRCNSVEATYWTACRDDGEPAHLRAFLPVISSAKEHHARAAERERLGLTTAG